MSGFNAQRCRLPCLRLCNNTGALKIPLSKKLIDEQPTRVANRPGVVLTY